MIQNSHFPSLASFLLGCVLVTAVCVFCCRYIEVVFFLFLKFIIYINIKKIFFHSKNMHRHGHEQVKKYDYDYFSKCFLLLNVSLIFFLKKKIFLISAHQNDIKT
jgi:hypothetical protein